MGTFTGVYGHNYITIWVSLQINVYLSLYAQQGPPESYMQSHGPVKSFTPILIWLIARNTIKVMSSGIFNKT